MRKSQFQGSGSWLFFLTLMAVLMAWNWELLLATSLGVMMMVVLYQMQAWDWKSRWAEVRRLMSGPNRRLTVAVAGGGGMMLCTYWAISLWMETDNGWLAASEIFEGLGILAILGVLVAGAIASPSRQQELELDTLLLQMTDPEPLRRLLAMRRIKRLLYSRYGQQESGLIFDALRLALSRESEPVVRDAVLESLQMMTQGSKWSSVSGENPPVSIPLNLQSEPQAPVCVPPSAPPQLRRRR